MIRSRRVATLAVAVAVVCAGAGGTAAGFADADGEDSAMAVSVIRAANHCFTDRLAASGTFAPRHAVDLRPDREGLVVSDVSVEPGDVVTKDQVLAKLVSAQGQGQGGQAQEVSLKAPVAGVILSDTAIVGAYTSPGSNDPLFRIAEHGDIDLHAEILATSLPRLRAGMAAKIHVVGLGSIDGRVAAIDDGVEAKTQLGTLRLTVTSDPRLLVGAFARAEIDAGQSCGLTIPLSALLFGPEGPVVGIVQADRVVMRSVSTGLLEGGNIEIRDGLTENDAVIARAGPFLREGDHVRPIADR